MQQFFNLLSWRLFTAQHVPGVFPLNDCSHWAPDDGRGKARNTLGCKQTSG